MTFRVLISGAGVAGMSLAYWLGKSGFDVSIVERAQDVRQGGQAVDIRGVALDVVEAMGLLPQVRELRTRLRGMSTLDRNGIEIARTEERTFSAGRLDSPDIEIFRDDLCALLQQQVSRSARFRFGAAVRKLSLGEDHVDVEFADGGGGERFDLVIGADGVYSGVRALAFGDESCVKPLGVVLALFTTPNMLDLHDWQLMHREDEFGCVIYPSRAGDELRVGAGFAADHPVPRGDVEAQITEIASRCAHLNGPLRRAVDALDAASPLYYGELAQIHMPRWSRKRVVLAGDAAHCASPFSGQGTSLALVGAFVLAKSLAGNTTDPAAALDSYERRMRPFVDLNQALVDLTRKGPVPDDELTRAKNGIDLRDLLA